MATEISGLIDFLHTLVTKQPKQIVPLKFAKTYLRIGIILVAKTDKILQTGVGPYVFAMNTSLKADLETVYVLIFDKDWLGEVDREALNDFNQKVAALQKELNTRTVAVKDFSLDFDFIDQWGKRRRATCIRYKSPTGN